MGASQTPPQDVAHVQFRSRIAFKLVWTPPLFNAFVIVDDEGKLLNIGHPTGRSMPSLRERAMNYKVVEGSKYGAAARKVGFLN